MEKLFGNKKVIDKTRMIEKTIFRIVVERLEGIVKLYQQLRYLCHMPQLFDT